MVRGRVYDSNVKKLDTIIEVYKSDKHHIMIHLLNLELFLRDDFNVSMLKQILEIKKVDYKTKKDIYDSFKNHSKPSNFTVEGGLQLMFQNADTQVLVLRFVNRLRAKVVQKHE